MKGRVLRRITTDRSAANTVGSSRRPASRSRRAIVVCSSNASRYARREVIIQNPYFAPDDGVCELLGMMVKRGVAVHLMVPGGRTDSPFVRRAGCYLYGDLLERGVRLYEFNPTLLHQKVVVVDAQYALVGGINIADKYNDVGDIPSWMSTCWVKGW